MDVLTRRWMRRPGFLVLLLAGLFICSCDSTNPVEPERPGNTPPSTGPGTDALTIDVSSNPSQIPPGSTTPATLTITVTRGGQPVADGTSGAITTNIGSFDATRSVTGLSFTVTGGRKQVQFYPPDEAGTANFLVQVDDASRQFSLPVRIAPFFLTAVEPNLGSAEGGTQVVITGAGFIDPVRVTFGKVVATNVEVRSETEIRAVTPRSPTPVDSGTTLTVDVSVTNGLNQSQPSSDMLAGGYTYVNGPTDPPPSQDDRPVVFSVVPASGPNRGGQEVAILGTGFVPPVQVFFGFADGEGFEGVQASVTSTTATRIEIETPAAAGVGQSLLNQLVDVMVRNVGTGFSTISSSAYRYQGEELFISAVTPRTGSANGGETVLVEGGGFRAPMQVVFAGVAQEVVDVLPRRITVRTVPVGVSGCSAPSGTVSVKTLDNGQTADSSILFTYTVPGQIVLRSLAPATLPQSGGTTTLSGTFPSTAANLRVEFGGVVSQDVSLASGQVTATVPVFTGAFDTEPCDDNEDGTDGTRFKNTAVDVKITDLSTGCTDTLSKALTYTPSNTTCQGDTGAPVADFIFNIPGTGSRTVFFEDRSTGGKPTSYQWQFGNGSSSSQQNPQHTYAADGTYMVTLTVSNSAGTNSISKPVTVPVPVSP
ncbi:MAG TPA: IPT/TIG domain-containing protein [Thermoanaerobaculia bacterium]|nr:IPT/TIG domain-containing protein [Thermoanaerobaculia bacterium]